MRFRTGKSLFPAKMKSPSEKFVTDDPPFRNEGVSIFCDGCYIFVGKWLKTSKAPTINVCTKFVGVQFLSVAFGIEIHHEVATINTHIYAPFWLNLPVCLA